MSPQKTATRSVFLVVTLLFAPMVSAGEPSASEADREAVLAANDLFYTALNAMFKGDPEPYKDVWWHTDDIVYMGAGGSYVVGWEKVYENWEQQAALKIGGKVGPEDVRVTIGGDMAMTNQYTVGFNKFHGKDTPVKLRSTSVFRKKDGQWKMICHHVDIIPVMSEDMGDG